MRGWVGIVALAAGLGVASASAQPLLIDDFTQGPATLHYAGPESIGNSANQTDLDPDSVIGGERHVSVGVATWSGTVIETPATLTIDPDATNGRFQFRSAIASEGSALSYVNIRYPAGDNMWEAPPLGIDATQYGNAFRIQTVRSNLGDHLSPVGRLPLDVSVGTRLRGAGLPLLNREDPYDLIIPFSSFGSDADFRQLDRIRISGARLPQGFQLSFDVIEIIDVLPGDATLDGTVGISDLSILAANWQQEGFWARGDFNGDGMINASDLSILAANWQAGVVEGPHVSLSEAMAMFDAFNGVVVPEPATAGVALLLGLGLLHRAHPKHTEVKFIQKMVEFQPLLGR